MDNIIYITSSQYIYIDSGYNQNTVVYYNINSQFDPDNQSQQYSSGILINQNILLKTINFNKLTEQYSEVSQFQFIRLLQNPYLYYTGSK